MVNFPIDVIIFDVVFSTWRTSAFFRGWYVKMANFVEKSLKVIALTNDGDDLSQSDLKLVEAAVNGFLSEEGEILFERMFERVTSGNPPCWLHDIEHLTADQEGYIYWKGINVEHYDYPEAESSKETLQEIAKRCLHIESLDLIPTSRGVIWNWDWMRELKSDHVWLHTISRSPQCWSSKEGLVLAYKDGELEYYSKDGKHEIFESFPMFLEAFGVNDCEDLHAAYHQMKRAGFSIADAGQKENLGFCFATLSGVIALFEKYGVKPLEKVA
jgi:hypothetical protein